MIFIFQCFFFFIENLMSLNYFPSHYIKKQPYKLFMIYLDEFKKSHLNFRILCSEECLTTNQSNLLPFSTITQFYQMIWAIYCRWPKLTYFALLAVGIGLSLLLTLRANFGPCSTIVNFEQVHAGWDLIRYALH